MKLKEPGIASWMWLSRCHSCYWITVVWGGPSVNLPTVSVRVMCPQWSCSSVSAYKGHRVSQFKKPCVRVYSNGGQGYKIANLNWIYTIKYQQSKISIQVKMWCWIWSEWRLCLWGSSRDKEWDFDTCCPNVTPLLLTSWNLLAINTSSWTAGKTIWCALFLLTVCSL